MSVYKRIPIAMNKGRAILEYDGAMCRVTINLQGMPTDRLCRPCLLWEDTFMPLPKPLFVDKNGRCALRCELEAENPHKIRAVAITDDSLNCIDIGFTREKYNWQQCFMAREEKPEDKKEETFTAEPVNSKAITEDKKSAEPIEDKATTGEKKSTVPTESKATANEEKSTVPTESKPATADKPTEPTTADTEKASEPAKKEVFKSIVCRLGEDIRELQEYAHMPDNTQHLFESRNKVTPFYGCEGVWIKINLRELAYAGSMWKYINNPLVLYACRRYHHLLLGKGAEGLMLGVPWEYDPEYRLEAEIQGFKTIKPIENTSPQKGTMCYLITTM